MSMKSHFRPALALTATLLLGACSSPFSTNWLASGYTHDDDSPITSPRPSQPWDSSAEIKDTEILATNTAAWQGAVFELVDKLLPGLPAGQPLALQTEGAVTAQKQAMDHYLRQALLRHGVTVTSPGASAATLVYNVRPLGNDEVYALALKRLGPDLVPARESSRKGFYLLQAGLASGLAKGSGDELVLAVLPGEKVEYHRWPGFTTQPARGQSTSRPPVYVVRD